MSLPDIEFPFSAVTGQATLKTALLLAAINPAIGGVLISGPRGSAKSTLARSLAQLLRGNNAEQARPFVTLPLGASEDMLLGTLDLQQVLNEKTVAFHPGLLAKADGGILYVDEVNLLADTLVDLLLDVAASGVNRIERDGISHAHSAQFVLIGTMNPDEGELRAQLLDRFGLMVELDNRYTLAQRIEVVKRREQFDRDPHAFAERYRQQQQRLIETIYNAKAMLSRVMCCDAMRETIAKRCSEAQVEGLRSDIVWYRSSLAHAALCGRDKVSEVDLDAVQALVLNHRQHVEQAPPPSSPGSSSFLPPGINDAERRQSDKTSDVKTSESHSSEPQMLGQWGEMPAQPATTDVAAPLSQKNITAINRNDPLRFNAEVYSQTKGRSVCGNTRTRRPGTAVNWHNTLIHSANTWPPPRLRFHWQKTAAQVMHLILLDASASTLGHRLINHAKAIALGIARQAYLTRAQLQVLSFAGTKVHCVLRAGRAPKQLKPLLDQIQVGGGTPLRVALLHTRRVLLAYLRRAPAALLRTYLITDGRSTACVDDIALPGETCIIDTEQSVIKRGRARQIAQSLGADYIPLPARG